MNFSIVLILAIIGVYANAAPNICKEREILPHEYDCTKYYKCLRGELVEFECQKGFWWNQELKYCDTTESSGCIPPTSIKSTETPVPTTRSTESTATPEPTSENPTTESTESTPQSTSETTPGETDAEIIARVCDPTKVSLERYPRSCFKYVYCAQENSAVKKCTEYEECSATRKIFLSAEGADCSEDDEEPTTGTIGSTTETTTTSTTSETTSTTTTTETATITTTTEKTTSTTTTIRTTTLSDQEIIDAPCDPVTIFVPIRLID